MKKTFALACVAAAVTWMAAGSLTAAPKPRHADAPKAPAVVRPTTDFEWIGAGGKRFPLKNLRGQPVVILVAPSPDAKPLRQEAGRIQELYLQFSARKTVFFAAFTNGQDGRVESNVPYAMAANGAAVATAYGVDPSKFSVIVVGPDGNVDMVSQKVEGAQRILDIINNNGQVQAATRTGLGS